MEGLRAVALEEIALEGRTGCSLPRLWQLLEDRMPLDGVQQLLPVLKQHLWQQLRAEPTLILSTEQLQAEAKAAAASAPAKKPNKRKKKTDEEEEAGADTLLGGRPTASLPLDEVPEGVAEAEAAHIVLVAPEHAWLSVVGVFDELYATQQLSGPQLNTLEIVGQSRHAGAVSAEMANALGIQHRNFFYVLKMLEARGLIVRSKLMLPDGKGNSGWTTTQLIHLPRFAPRLAIGREAIIREVKVSDGGAKKAAPSQEAPAAAAAAAAAAGSSGGAGSSKRSSGAGGGNRLVVRDDAVTLKEICDFLAQQGAGKYVSESQVKTVLGFTGSTAAHRQWRRLRLRLVKLGCISVDTGLLGNKALSVLKLLKPYKLKVPVVVDSDEDELQAELDEAADADEEGGTGGDKAAADADTPAAAAAADGEGGDAGGEAAAAAAAGSAGGGDGAGSSKASRLQGVPVEVGQNQMLLELICESGQEGVLTPSLTRRMGISPKLFLKGLPDMCKKYGVKAEYDMTKKTLTNRITAPQHLLEAYAVQQAALNGASSTLTPAPSAPLPAAAAAGGGAGGSTGIPPSAALPPRPPSAKPPAARGGTDGGSQQQQGQLSRQGSASQSVMSDATAAAAAAAAAGDSAAAADAATAATSAGTAAAAADGLDAMDIDALVDAAVEKVVREQQQQQQQGTQDQEPTEQQPEVPADAAAAAAAASAAAAAGVAGAGVTRGINFGGGSWGTAPVPHGTAASGGVGRRTVMGVSRHQLRRLEALRAKLREQGFFLQQEVRSVIAVAEAKQTDKPPPPGGRGPEGPDTRTCNRLVQHLLDAGEVTLARLQYNQELVATTREVDVFVPKGTELNEELLQRIAAYNSTLLRSIRQRSVKRREVLLQGAKVLGVADSEGADKTALELNAPRAMAVTSGKEPPAADAAAADGGDGQPSEAAAADEAAAEPPAAAAAGPSPEKHQLQLLMPGPSIRRRLRGFRSLAVLHKGSAGAAAAGKGPPTAPEATAAAAADVDAAPGRGRGARKSSTAVDVSQHFPASERRAPVTTLGASLMASLGVKDSKASQEPYKGAAIMRMHHNGYIPSTMLRAKLLHQYLAGLAGLKVEHHEDIHPTPPQPPPPAAAAAAAVGTGGAVGTPSRRRQLRFVFDKAEQSESGKGEEDAIEILPRPNVVEQKRQAAERRREAEEANLPAIPAAAAAGDAGGAGGQQGQQAGTEQWSKLEQQLGGRLLSVQDLWLNMPLALALQVAGVTCNISNLLQLVCNTDPPPRICDFDKEQIAAVFEARSWSRVVASMSVLARLKLLTPARRRRTDGGEADQQEGGDGEQQREEDDPSQGWVQSQARTATHLVVGASGVLDMPPFAPAEDATGPQDDTNAEGVDLGGSRAPSPAAAAAAAAAAGSAADAGGGAEGGQKRVSYDFRRAGHWRQYWGTLQRVFDCPLMTPELVANTFPSNAVPDVARHRSWVWYRGLPMRPWLRLLERIHDLPIEQLDQHMARTLADELGVPYQPVLVVITRWRTEANEERERQGLGKVYLLEHKAAEQEALRAAQAAAGGTEGLTGRTGRELRKMRATAHKQRRLKRCQQREASRRRKADGEPTHRPGRRARSQPSDPAAAAAAAAGEAAAADPDGSDSDDAAAAAAAAAGGAGSLLGGEAAAAGGSGGDGSSSESEDYEARSRAANMPQIVFRLSVQNTTEPLQPLTGRRGQGKRPESAAGAAGGGGEGDEGGDGAAEGGAAVPMRHRWTPEEDKQLLRWVLANRVELGTRDTIRWRSSASAALPLGQEACARRLAFFKRKPQIKAFIDNLQAQAIQIHREFSRRRHALRQQLQRLQQQRRLSVNPLLLREAAAGKQQIVPPPNILQLANPNQDDMPLKPLQPPPLAAEPPAGGSAAAASAAAAGAADTAVVSEAASVLASAGPYVLNPNGSIMLLPDASIQQRLNRLMSLIDAFAAPRKAGGRPGPRGGVDGLGPARGSRGRREGGLDGPRHKRRRVGPHDLPGGDGEGDGDLEEYSSGEEEEEDGMEGQEGDEWSSGGSEDEFQLLRAVKQQRQHQQRRKGTSGGSSRRSRQVAPLKTVADQVAAMAALQTSATAATAAVLAQRRAAGEVIGPQEEQAEMRAQLLLLKQAGKRRRKQQQPPGSDIISDPKELLQSWRKHQAVETRPTGVGGAAAAAASASGQGQDQQQQAVGAGAEGADGTVGAEGSAAAGVVGGDGDVEAVAAGGQVVAVAPVVRPWRYGASPTLPVVHAMHLIVSLLQLVEVGGSLPADASTALLVRFSQAEVAAAFRWLSALGWLNAGAAKRGFQLSRTWAKHMRAPDRTLADLLDRTPAATLALAHCGLGSSSDTSAAPAAAVGQPEDAVAEAPTTAAAAAGSAEHGTAGRTGSDTAPAAPTAAAAAAAAGEGVERAGAAAMSSLIAAVGGAAVGGRTLQLQAAFDLEEGLRQQQQQQQQGKQPQQHPASAPAAAAASSQQQQGEGQGTAAAGVEGAGGGDTEQPAAAAEGDAMDVDTAAAEPPAAEKVTGSGAAAAKPAAAGPAAELAVMAAELAAMAADGDAPAAPAAAADAGHTAAAAAADGKGGEAGAAASGGAKGSSSSSSRASKARRQLAACTAVLHPRVEQPGSFWVGAHPPPPPPPAAEGSAPGPTPTPPTPAAAAVPGALLLQLLCGAAAGEVSLQLVSMGPQQGSSVWGGSRASGMSGVRGFGRHGDRMGSGSMGNLLRKAPMLLVAASKPLRRPATAAAAAEVTEMTVVGEEGDEKPPAAAEGGDGAGEVEPRQAALVPYSAAAVDSSSKVSLLAYAGSTPAAAQQACSAAAARKDAAAAETATAAGAAAEPEKSAGKRKRSHAAKASTTEQQQQELLEPAAAGGAAAGAAPSASFSLLAVGGDEQRRQEAEAACLAAAAAPAAAGNEGGAEGSAPQDRPQKRQRKQAGSATATAAAVKAPQEQKDKGHPAAAAAVAAATGTEAGSGDGGDQAVGAGSSSGISRGVLPVELLRWLLATIRAAEAGGVSESQLAAALHTAVAAAGKEQQEVEGGPTPVSAEAENAEQTMTEAAASAEATAAAAAAAAGTVLGGMPVAVSRGLRSLAAYGLVRRVCGWYGPAVWVSAEGSTRLLAWPVPTKPEQLQGQPAPSTAAAGAAALERGKADAPQPPAAAAAVADAAADSGGAAGTTKDKTSLAAPSAAAGGGDGEGVLLAPWLDHRGCLNRVMWQGLVKRLMCVVLRNPGIPEPLLLAQLDAISPAAAQQLLEVLVQQQHLLVRDIPVPVPADAGVGSVGSTAAVDGGSSGSSVAAGGSSVGGGAVSSSGERPALKLGLALGKCLATGPAKPPSMLMGGRRSAAAAGGGGKAGPLAAAGGAGSAATSPAAAGVGSSGGAAGVQGVRHYWPSLSSSSVCHLTALPPCRTAAAVAV